MSIAPANRGSAESKVMASTIFSSGTSAMKRPSKLSVSPALLPRGAAAASV